MIVSFAVVIVTTGHTVTNATPSPWASYSGFAGGGGGVFDAPPDFLDGFDSAEEKSAGRHREFLAGRSGPPFGPERSARPAAFNPRRRWLARHRSPR